VNLPHEPNADYAPPAVIVQIKGFRATIYREGGISFEYRSGIAPAWYIDDEPPAELEQIADKCRTAVYG